jgi:hypothetical protein
MSGGVLSESNPGRLSPTSEVQSRRAALSRPSSVDAFGEQPYLPAVRCSRSRSNRGSLGTRTLRRITICCACRDNVSL